MLTTALTGTSRTFMTAEGGVYALVLFCSRKGPVQIGKLGRLQLRRGFYVYVGSALGPGGVRARVAHHRKLSHRPHWHIDYLRPHTRLDRIWYSPDRICREHQWARVICALRGAAIPMAGFGSSDCRCKTHLFFFTSRPSFREFRQRALGSVRAGEVSPVCVTLPGGEAGRLKVKRQMANVNSGLRLGCTARGRPHGRRETIAAAKL